MNENITKLKESDMIINQNKAKMSRAMEANTYLVNQIARKERSRKIEFAFWMFFIFGLGYLFACHILPWAIAGFPVN